MTCLLFFVSDLKLIYNRFSKSFIIKEFFRINFWISSLEVELNWFELYEGNLFKNPFVKPRIIKTTTISKNQKIDCTVCCKIWKKCNLGSHTQSLNLMVFEIFSNGTSQKGAYWVKSDDTFSKSVNILGNMQPSYLTIVIATF